MAVTVFDHVVHHPAPFSVCIAALLSLRLGCEEIHALIISRLVQKQSDSKWKV